MSSLMHQHTHLHRSDPSRVGHAETPLAAQTARPPAPAACVVSAVEVSAHSAGAEPVPESGASDRADVLAAQMSAAAAAHRQELAQSAEDAAVHEMEAVAAALADERLRWGDTRDNKGLSGFVDRRM